MSSVQSWHVTGGISPEIPDITPQNSMEEFASWLRSDETPLIYKIGAIALPVILGYALGLLIGRPLLGSIVVTLAATIAACLGWCALFVREQRAIEEAQLEEEAAAIFADIKNAVGGEEVFNALPQLRVPGSRLDFVEVLHLHHPIMRGIDTLERPFISLKLRSNSPNAPQEPFVITFFQRTTLDRRWSYGALEERINDAQGNPFFNRVLGPADFTLIHQIVVERNHPVLSLV